MIMNGNEIGDSRGYDGSNCHHCHQLSQDLVTL